eukprot:993270-Prorocentrum_minimum.AAC.1
MRSRLIKCIWHQTDNCLILQGKHFIGRGGRGGAGRGRISSVEGGAEGAAHLRSRPCGSVPAAALSSTRSRFQPAEWINAQTTY